MKAVLFDFDGTLVHLPIDYASARRRLKGLFSRFGVKSNFHPLLESIEDSLSELENDGLTKTLVRKIKRKAYAIINEEERLSVEGARQVDQVRETLAAIKKKRLKFAIVSRNGTECIKKCISKLNIPEPDLVVAREDTQKLKPDPQHLTIALKKLRLKPDEVIVVGDSYHDIAAGKGAGIMTVLFAPRKKRAEIELAPEHVISDLPEVLNLLRGRL
jgi:phosphoglycolate phosphatase